MTTKGERITWRGLQQQFLKDRMKGLWIPSDFSQENRSCAKRLFLAVQNAQPIPVQPEVLPPII